MRDLWWVTKPRPKPTWRRLRNSNRNEHAANDDRNVGPCSRTWAGGACINSDQRDGGIAWHLVAKRGDEKLPSPVVIPRWLEPKFSSFAYPADGGGKVEEPRLDGFVINLPLPRVSGVLIHEMSLSTGRAQLTCSDRLARRVLQYEGFCRTRSNLASTSEGGTYSVAEPL